MRFHLISLSPISIFQQHKNGKLGNSPSIFNILQVNILEHLKLSSNIHSAISLKNTSMPRLISVMLLFCEEKYN